MKFRLSSVLLAAVLLTSVGRAQTLTLKESTPLFPLTPGNTWTYKVTGDKDAKAATVKVSGIEKFGDTTAARLEWSRGGKLIATELYTVEKDGVYKVENGGVKFDKPICFIRIPLPKDKENWKFESKVGDKENKGTFTVGRETVTVPAGTYKDAVTVSSRDFKVDVRSETGGLDSKTDMTVKYWYAEKVGLVKSVVEIGGASVTLELEKAELK